MVTAGIYLITMPALMFLYAFSLRLTAAGPSKGIGTMYLLFAALAMLGLLEANPLVTLYSAEN